MFESHGNDNFNGRSPGGFEFGVTGWIWNQPVPKSITFFLDNTAMICDQYGRPIRQAILADGRQFKFADSPPADDRNSDMSRPQYATPRPSFATHAQLISALKVEGIDWLSYHVQWVNKSGRIEIRNGMTKQEAYNMQAKILQDEGNSRVVVDRTIACAGWPQLPYDELKKLPELPPTPEFELMKIRDPELRKAALRIRREVEQEREKELQTTTQE